MTEIKLHFGALADRLKVQLDEHGLTMPDPDVHRFQGHADALTRLYLAHLMPESWVEASRKRLFKQIMTCIKEHNNA